MWPVAEGTDIAPFELIKSIFSLLIVGIPISTSDCKLLRTSMCSVQECWPRVNWISIKPDGVMEESSAPLKFKSIGRGNSLNLNLDLFVLKKLLFIAETSDPESNRKTVE